MKKNIEKASILFLENGPMQVTGTTHFTGQYGEKHTDGSAIYLCRCGESKNKPACDGTHKICGFRG